MILSVPLTLVRMTKFFFGKVDGIDDLVSFEGSSVSELKAAFESSVDDYIEFCKLKKA